MEFFFKASLSLNVKLRAHNSQLIFSQLFQAAQLIAAIKKDEPALNIIVIRFETFAELLLARNMLEHLTETQVFINLSCLQM